MSLKYLSRYKILILSCAIFLFSLSWYVPYLSVFVFIIFMPLFVIVNLDTIRYIPLFLSILIVLIFWNTIVCDWILISNFSGGLIIIFFNSFLFLIPFLLFRIINKEYGSPITANLVFILSWISLELLHDTWEWGFPFFTLGYRLASFSEIIQWYEFTGVFGGSVWILVTNSLLYYIIFRNKYKYKVNYYFLYILIIFLPILISFLINLTYRESGSEVSFIALHPDTDCKNYKYKVPYDTLIDEYLESLIPELDKSTEYVLWPETAITKGILHHSVDNDVLLMRIKDTICKYSNAKLISGVFIDEIYSINPFVDLSVDIPNIKYSKENKCFYLTYNAAIQLECNTTAISLHTKKKLVPIEETAPESNFFKYLTKWIPSLGKFGFSYKKDDDYLFEASDKPYMLAPLICYESFFSNYTVKFVNGGANLIVVMLNEGWYNNLEVSNLFLKYSIVRAVENRRSIARSSNRGITCFIDQKGKVTAVLKSFEKGTLKSTLRINDKITFYTKYSNYINSSIPILLIVLFANIIIFTPFIRFLKRCSSKF